jgi:hypothetical protein
MALISNLGVIPPKGIRPKRYPIQKASDKDQAYPPVASIEGEQLEQPWQSSRGKVGRGRNARHANEVELTRRPQGRVARPEHDVRPHQRQDWIPNEGPDQAQDHRAALLAFVGSLPASAIPGLANRAADNHVAPRNHRMSAETGLAQWSKWRSCIGKPPRLHFNGPHGP